MKRKHVWTKDYMAPAPQLDESTTVLGCKGAEVKHKQKSRRGKSCSTRMMIYDGKKGSGGTVLFSSYSRTTATLQSRS